ncbi:major capsid protein [Capybara microvirus Cap3_SP_450]|nr:major capsid protein [Capybara microvirus Cap3_SP_450]
MNRNTEAHFAQVPTININRSKFNRPHGHKTTMNTGELIPIYVDADILPGDTISMEMSSLIRMTTPIYPVMDNSHVDLYWFFVPNRLLWTHWREFWGENRETHWEQQVEYEIPQIKAPTGGWKKGTIADYMGIPTKINNIEVNALPFRAYAKIVNDWFIDENLKDPCMINLDETTLTGTNEGDYVINTQLGAKPFMAAKPHDYFTSCLPSPQKGPSVALPLGGIAPVIGTDKITHAEGAQLESRLLGKELEYYVGQQANYTGMQDANGTTLITQAGPKGIGLGVDLSSSTAATINQLRQAFAIQRFYEAQARGGTRYIEFIKNIFGVTSPDARQQRAEYLGGHRCRINIDQVLQTSSTDTVSPQGNTAAYSLTIDHDKPFTFSASEHGILMCLAVIRTEHTYQQGLERMWSRKKWSDFYVPQFANLGEQAVLNKEIYAQGTEVDDEAFGYQEAWAEYRYKPNRISGALRSNYEQSLDAWHYADDYDSLPYLSSEWIDETTKNVDRTLAVTSELENQYIADFYFDPIYTRPMPVYSVPGLLDHH